MFPIMLFLILSFILFKNLSEISLLKTPSKLKLSKNENISLFFVVNKLFIFFILFSKILLILFSKIFFLSLIKLNYFSIAIFILLKLSLQKLLINPLKSAFGINSVVSLKLFFKLSNREEVPLEKF